MIHSRYLAVAVLLCSAVCQAAEPKATASAVIVAPNEVAPGDLLVLDASSSDAASFEWRVYPTKTILPVDAKKRCVFASGQPGEYLFILATAKGDAVAIAEHKVRVGQPGPTPIPPGPGPTPVVEGKRAVLIVYESADQTPEVSSLLVALRKPPAATYLQSKGHTLSILDDDAVDQDGKPAAAVEAWRPQFAGLTLPALLIVDPASKSLVHKQSLPASATADNVIEILKQHGG